MSKAKSIILSYIKKNRPLVVVKSLHYKGKQVGVRIEIGKYTVSISAYAFKGCSKLKRVIIPKTIQSIDNLAFVGCHSLKDVYFVGSKAEYQAKNAVNKAFSAKVNVHFNYVKPVKQKKR